MLRRLWIGVIMMNIVSGMVASGSAEYGDQGERKLTEDWMLISGDAVHDMAALHQVDWSSSDAFATAVPSTVFGALVDAGKMGDPFWGTNLEDYDTEPYQKPWIYRTVFALDASIPSEHVELIFEGINFRGNVWLNGELVSDSDEFVGPYRMYRFDVSGLVKPENNVLVVEIIPPAKDDLTIGWVDWNPYPADNNMGIWRPVKVKQSGAVSLRDPFVKTNLNLDDFSAAELEVLSVLENHAAKPVSGVVEIKYELGSFELPFKLGVGESKPLVLDSNDFAQLSVSNPKVWWPHDLGEQPLYHMEFNVLVDGNTSESHLVRFGIREVSDYINAEGHRGWKVNGKKVLIRGGGWVDDLFLREDPQRVEDQLDYVRHMNLNTVRLEGFWGSSKRLFDLCDEKGILLMIGWTCHWEWENYCHRPQEDYLLIRSDEEEFQAKSFADQVRWLRNNPSVLMWVFGSDRIPRPSLEKKLWEELDKVDATRPRLLGCRNEAFGGEVFYSSEAYGPVAVKMVGPYHYVTPNYWYEDKQLGGAFGFNTETGPGLQPAVLESVKKFTPEDKLWPLNEVWDFHTGRGDVFGDFKEWIAPFEGRYGASDSVEDFCHWAQVSNYEAIRPMFEAFAANKPVATGVIQWMLNSAFPNHLWQLYDYYLMPTGAFYGTKKSCQLVNAVYDYGAHRIVLTNDTLEAKKGFSLEIKMLDRDSKLILTKQLQDLEMNELSSSAIFDLPELKGGEASIHFLDLRLKNERGDEIANNFYWLSNLHEAFDYEKATWYNTPNTQYADFSGLRTLPQAKVDAVFETKGIEAGREIAEVTIHNDSERIAFFIELSVRDSKTGKTLLPVFWEDNYVSLLPGETRILRVEYPEPKAHQAVEFSWKCLNAENPQ